MKLTKIPALTLALILLPAGSAFAASEGAHLEHAGNDIYSQASLQRGARNFVNYCLGCHSAKFVRWNRVATDLSIPEATLKSELMFAGGPVHETMHSPMPVEDARRWFGNAPPDLSLMSRARSTDYIYTFLKSFYRDPSRPHGVNNLVLPNAAMPHVLADLQGVQLAVLKTEKGENGQPHEVIEKLEAGTPGSLTPAQFDEFVRDTVNFVQYMGEPIEAKRRTLGVWVILFLLLFVTFAWLLYKEYWKDVK